MTVPTFTKKELSLILLICTLHCYVLEEDAEKNEQDKAELLATQKLYRKTHKVLKAKRVQK